MTFKSKATKNSERSQALLATLSDEEREEYSQLSIGSALNNNLSTFLALRNLEALMEYRLDFSS